MSAVTRWQVKHSIKYPGRWLVYGLCGDRIVPDTYVTFRTWGGAMAYVNSKTRWTRR